MRRRAFVKYTGAGIAGLLFGRDALSYGRKQRRPDILWLTVEDCNISWIGCYGNPGATTPNIDKLAQDGFRYTNCFANAPVCGPSRSTWITGVNAVSMGTHPMRSRYEIPHGTIKYYPDYLRAAGYYCSNHTKTDYNIGGRDDTACWDSAEEYGWQKRAPDQPFFCVINNNESHESKAFGSVENTKHDPQKILLHKYHPDIPDIRKNYAHYADAIEKMDAGVGKALAQLDAEGLTEDTIVIFCSDNGGVMPRSKRFLYDSGTHLPFIVRIPEKYKYLWPAEKHGVTVDRLVSFIDMPKTWLSLAGAAIPGVMQGRIFMGPDSEPEAQYHFAFRGRMDNRFDEMRAIRDKRFLYIKNYMPYVSWGQYQDYSWRMAATRAWVKAYKSGKTDEVTGLFFKTKPYPEELYDCSKDPDNVCNLVCDPEFRPVLDSMRRALREHQMKIYDSGLLPEHDMVKRASDNSVTVYEMVRNPALYDLQAYLDAADLALAGDKGNMAQLTGFIANKDSAIRYWGAAGLLMTEAPDTNAVNALESALRDDSHEVRAIAAWALIKAGRKESGRNCLINLLESGSYATLKVLNIIDWMDDDKAVYIAAVKAASGDGLVRSLKRYILHGDSGDASE